MTKTEFIEKIKRSKGVVDYEKTTNDITVRVKFTNMSSKKKDWFMLKCWHNKDSEKVEIAWVYQSPFISDIVREFRESV